MKTGNNRKIEYRINGWLLVLCYQLLIFNPLILAIALEQQVVLLFKQTVPAIIIIDAMVSILVILLGIIAGKRLLFGRAGAITTIKAYLLVSIAYNLILVNLSLIDFQLIIQKNFPVIFISVLVSLSWYAYLQRSKRVKNMFSNAAVLEKKMQFSQLILVVTLLFITIIFMIIRSNYQVFYIPTGSMEPAIHSGDYVVALKTRNYTAKRGDIVVFLSPEQNNKLYVKRVIAIAGDAFVIKNKQLYVNNNKLIEQYVRGYTPRELNSIKFEKIVPPHKMVVLGDNREHSEDSRHYGYINEKSVTGRAIAILFNSDLRFFRVGTIR